MKTPKAGPIDLRSDTFTKPTAAMYEALRDAPLGDDVYGEDPTVRRLEERAAELTGKEAALLVSSGTQGNLVALMALCERGDEVLLGAHTDLYNFENGGLAVLAGLYPRPFDDETGWIRPEAAEAAIRPKDVHFGRTRVLAVENSHARSGGTPIPLGALQELADLAELKGLIVHMDGARLFNAAVAMDVDPAEITRFAETVTFCLSKGLSCPAGSVLCGTAGVIDKARRIRKMLGGGMRQSGWIAAPGLVALGDIGRLAEDHRRARKLAELLAGIEGIKVKNDVRTNIVIVETEEPVPSARCLIEALRGQGVLCFSIGKGVRMVVHRWIGDEDIDEVAAATRRAVAAAGRRAADAPASPY
ncbi:MAG TPA: GntG family PLP-dependent aldolase [Microvirga sp.]|nr:GntG family PLP-dependent aldolase [Microvirga sp.]